MTFRTDLGAALGAFLDEQAQRLVPLGTDADRLVAEARTAVAGGKKFRAAFCQWGFRAFGTLEDAAQEQALLRACASLELLHASALAHDDLMDASVTRRGRPAAHRAFETENRRAAWRGGPGHAVAAGQRRLRT